MCTFLDLVFVLMDALFFNLGPFSISMVQTPWTCLHSYELTVHLEQLCKHANVVWKPVYINKVWEVVSNW